MVPHGVSDHRFNLPFRSAGSKRKFREALVLVGLIETPNDSARTEEFARGRKWKGRDSPCALRLWRGKRRARTPTGREVLGRSAVPESEGRVAVTRAVWLQIGGGWGDIDPGSMGACGKRLFEKKRRGARGAPCQILSRKTGYFLSLCRANFNAVVVV